MYITAKDVRQVKITSPSGITGASSTRAELGCGRDVGFGASRRDWIQGFLGGLGFSTTQLTPAETDTRRDGQTDKRSAHLTWQALCAEPRVADSWLREFAALSLLVPPAELQ